jgi:hypothetical protein
MIGIKSNLAPRLHLASLPPSEPHRPSPSSLCPLPCPLATSAQQSKLAAAIIPSSLARGVQVDDPPAAGLITNFFTPKKQKKE